MASIISAKIALKYSTKYKCTPDMLYLTDDKVSLRDVGYLDKYTGDITSCLRILDETSGNISRRAQKLAKTLDIGLVHKCVMIYMGETGNIDYTYLDIFPECKEMITQVGNIVEQYYHQVADYKKLYKLVRDVETIPDFVVDTSTIVCKLSQDINIVSLFEHSDKPFDILMEVSAKNIRRKISTKYPPKDIDRAYIRPNISSGTDYVMIRLDDKDFTVFSDSITTTRKPNTIVDTSMALNIVRLENKHICISNQYETNTRIQFGHEQIWHRRVMAFVASNYKPFDDIIELEKDVDFQSPYTGAEKEMLAMYIPITSTKCTFKNKSVVISGDGDELNIICSIAIISKLLGLYENIYEEVYKTLSGLHDVPKNRTPTKRVPVRTKIEDLRKQLPELFTSNYTRECHRLPVLLETKKQAREYEKMGRLVIKYPQTGPFTRWYSSPTDDLYVGLKTNRLSNKHIFKYIVVCYTSNHLLNPTKRTYQYYNNNDAQYEIKYKEDIKTLKALTPGRKGPIPRMMEVEYGVYNYKRLGVGGSFMDCVICAFGDKNILQNIKDNPCLLNVLEDSTYESVKKEIRSGNLDATLYYRLFEEVYHCNIIVVQVDHRGKYKLSLPRAKYIWDTCNYKPYVIILKNMRKLYQDLSITYELIIKNATLVFDKKDDLVSKLVATKRELTLRPSFIGEISDNIEGQYVDDDGRCVLLSLANGSMVECNTRPYARPLLDPNIVLNKCSTLYKHMLSMNDKCHRSDVWLTTTKDYLYFPNDISFVEWMDF